MVVHIVMIKFQKECSAEVIEEIKGDIDSLLGKVPTLLSMETGLNFSDEERAMDLVLTSTFADREGLNDYAVHPEHLKVIDKIKKVADYSRVVDYEKI